MDATPTLLISVICKCSDCFKSFDHSIPTQDNSVRRPFLDPSPVDFPIFFTYGTDKDPLLKQCVEASASEMSAVSNFQPVLSLIVCGIDKVLHELVDLGCTAFI